MLSQTSRYALRVLGYLVEQDGTRIPGERIAEATGVPANYLSKLLNQLRKRGIVDSEKGWGGGFVLCDEARATTIREVLGVFEDAESLRFRQCAFGMNACDPERPCPLHPYWERIRATLDEMLTTTRVADLGRPCGTSVEGDTG